MIYAIRAVGTEYIKIGKAQDVNRRRKHLQTGCPFELEVIASADWPDSYEDAIGFYLWDNRVRGEWFLNDKWTEEVVNALQAGEDGLRAFTDRLNELRSLVLEQAKAKGVDIPPGWRSEFCAALSDTAREIA